MKFIDLQKQYFLIKEDVKKSIDSVLDNSNYILGNQVNQLEKTLADYVGVKYCVTCSSGTDALLMSMMAWGIGTKDAVITTPFTYIATSEAIRLLGATPVFVDINPKTLNIDSDKIQDAINFIKNKGLRARVIIPVNIFGLCADYKNIKNISEQFNLLVLEDAAQSFGASVNNKKSCSFGDASATSFFPAKPLGCYGDGGAIFTNNHNLYEKLLSIRVHGKGKDKYDNVITGINGRLDTIQAAILLEKFKIFSKEMILRNEIAENYYSRLNKYFKMQEIESGYISSYAQFSIICENSMQREKILKALESNKIPTAVYYEKPLHLQLVNKDLGYKKGDFKIAEKISNKIFSVPMHPYLSKDEINKICDVILEVVTH